MSAPGPHIVVFVTGIGRFTVQEQETVEHFTTIVGQGLKSHMIKETSQYNSNPNWHVPP
jgi:hypothetical protein